MPVKINKKIDYTRLPKHIAFIMDGNRRWARSRGLVRHLGHEAGYRSMLKVVDRCIQLGVEIISFFAFSTENWGRTKDELDFMFDIVRDSMNAADIDKLTEYGAKVVTMGDVTKFPEDIQTKLKEAIHKTRNNSKCILNLCLNYGGRAEIVRAVNLIIDEKKSLLASGKNNDVITEESFKKYLYSGDLPDPDFIVRTSGEQRVSNFMLYQMAYTEFYFPNLYWPSVNEKFIDKCVIEYQKRKRRYGKV